MWERSATWEATMFMRTSLSGEIFPSFYPFAHGVRSLGCDVCLSVTDVKFERVISIITFRNITIVDPKFSYGQGVIIGSEVQRYLKHILLHLWKHFSGSSNEKHCVWRRASVTGCQLWSGKIPHMQRWSKTNFMLDEMKWRRWSKHKTPTQKFLKSTL